MSSVRSESSLRSAGRGEGGWLGMEDYSFVAWIASLLVYVCFLLWAFLPLDVLDSIGFVYYPSRYYAIALPAYVITAYALLCISYMGYNMLTTVEPSDFRSFSDKAHRERPAPPLRIKFLKGDAIPEIGDIDPVEISKLWR